MKDADYDRGMQSLGKKLTEDLEAGRLRGALDDEIDAIWDSYGLEFEKLREERMSGWTEEHKKNASIGWNAAQRNFSKVVEDLVNLIEKKA